MREARSTLRVASASEINRGLAHLSATQPWLPHPSRFCKVPGHPLHFVPRHPLHWWRGTGLRNPALDDFRALDSGVQFADQGGAVEHHHALFHSYDLHPFAGERSVDPPLFSFDLDLALAIHFQHPRSSWIVPARRMGIVAMETGLPQRRRSPHAERFVRSHVVVLPAIRIQPSLPVLPRHPAPLPCPLQRSVKTFHFALGLRMPNAAPVQPNALSHEP